MNVRKILKYISDIVLVNKLRSILTITSISIGIASVICIVSLGEGGKIYLLGEFDKLGKDIFSIYIDWRKNNVPTERDFNLDDIKVIYDNCENVMYISPVCSYPVTVQGKKGKKVVAVAIGTNGDYFSIFQNITLLWGRYYINNDVANHKNLVVIDEETSTQLFGKSNGLNETLYINGHSASVIGIVRTGNSVFSVSNQNKYIYVPLTFWQLIFDTQIIQGLNGRSRLHSNVDEAAAQVVDVLNKRHRYTERYTVTTLNEQKQMAKKFSETLTIIITFISCISLFVGGIGVMNIMLVSVTERTREIGIRKSIGAKHSDILRLFLAEALTLSVLGGIIGLILGILFAYAFSLFFDWNPHISVSFVFIAISFSMLVGLFFGIYPANKAALMDPVDALRAE